MQNARAVPSGQKVRISFETSLDTARCLKDLVKHYKVPIAQVLEVLICLEHESISGGMIKKGEPGNDFVQEPLKIRW